MAFNGIAVLHTDKRTLAIVTAHGSGKLTLDQIAAQLEMHRNTAYSSVKRLVHAGYLARTGRGRQGSTYQVINAHD